MKITNKIKLLVMILSITQVVRSDEIDDLIENAQPVAYCPPECPTTSELINFVLPPIFNLPLILQQDIYKSTVGPVTRRYLLDEPSLYNNRYDECGWTFNVMPFFNFSPKVYFTKCSPFLSSYIDFNNESIIGEIERVLSIFCPDININAVDVLSLFKDIKLRQYRVGAVLGFNRGYERLMFSFGIPLYYLLDHFFLTQCEQDAIENSALFSQNGTDENGEPIDPLLNIGSANRESMERFGRKHLANDKLGFGDARFDLMGKVFCSNALDIWLGFTSVIPTAVSFREGIIGGGFNSPCFKCGPPQPIFDLERLITLKLCARGAIPVRIAGSEINDELKAFGVAALDRVTTMLFNAPLGNGGHFAIGPNFDLIWRMTNCWTWHTYGYLRGYAKHKETRFFLVNKNPADFEQDFTVDAAASFAFFNQQIVNSLFPTPVCIDVRPGLLARFGQLFKYQRTNWEFTFGFDYWTQRGEKLFPKTVCSDQPIENCDLNFCKGTRPAAQQGKIFGTARYTGVLCDGCDWHLSINGDFSVFNQGIGKNFTLGVLIGIDF